MAHFLGLDLGGTNVKAGVTDESGRVVAKLSAPTNVQAGFDRVCHAMAEAGRQVVGRAKLKLADIAAIGVGSPGLLDFDGGIVLASPNFPDWVNVPLGPRLRDLLGRPTVIENDANAAGYGEFWAGAGRQPGVTDLVMLTLGTGIGGGVVIGGKVLHGGHGVGAEAGHMIVVPDGRACPCGQRGCIEAYASAAGTARRATEAMQAGEAGSLKAVLDKRGAIECEEVFDAARAGDKAALRIVDETANLLGVTCVTLSRLLDPQLIVFAGGMSLAGDFLFEKVREAYRRHNWRLTGMDVRIVPAVLGNDAGIIGAAGVAWSAWSDGRLGT
jgi:glucokinase